MNAWPAKSGRSYESVIEFLPVQLLCSYQYKCGMYQQMTCCCVEWMTIHVW